jgi:hypothetical protein
VDLFKAVGIERIGVGIDWELTPSDTFGTFESWGGRERVRNRSERFYYFYIDGWRKPPKVCLMERGIKYARILAVIDAPQNIVDTCIKEQGGIISLDRSYAINKHLRRWLMDNLLNNFSDRLITPLSEKKDADWEACDLGPSDALAKFPEKVSLPYVNGPLADHQILPVVKEINFFDSNLNPKGNFKSLYLDNNDNLTVTDICSGLTWQRAGNSQIITNRQASGYCRTTNQENFAGCNNWRLPTLSEGLSLLQPRKNSRGLHLHACFSDAQPFIFVDHRRHPGGQWYIDFNEGTVFWASGHNPGGFVRLCRTI